MIGHIAWRLTRRALVNLWRAPMPSLVSVLTIALALFLGAAFAYGLQAAQGLVQSWGAQATLTLYLKPQTADLAARTLGERVRAEHPELRVLYVDQQEALQRLRAELGEQGKALDGLTYHPLPPTIELDPRSPMPAAQVRQLAVEMARLPAVQEVDYGREWLDRLEALARAVRIAGAGALIAVLGAALLVVANTIRLAVYARRDEIEIMKLVGATDGYVRLPFLLEGGLQGLLGAGLALGGLFAVQRWLLPRAAEAFTFAAGSAAPHLYLTEIGLLAAAGALVGLLGSWLAVTRFLRT